MIYYIVIYYNIYVILQRGRSNYFPFTHPISNGLFNIANSLLGLYKNYTDLKEKDLDLMLVPILVGFISNS